MKLIKNKELKCGTCTYLIKDKFFDVKCSDLGKIPTSRSCEQHTPDMHDLIQGDEQKVDRFKDIAYLINVMSPRELEILGAFILNEKRTRRFGFKFYQKVYVRVYTADKVYLSHFTKCRVLDVTNKGLRLISETGQTTLTFLFNDERKILTHNIFTPKEFDFIRKQCIQDRKIKDPKQYVTRSKSVMNLDDLSESRSTQEFDIEKVRKNKKPDLVTVIDRMQRGIFKPEKYESDDPLTIKW